jgi:transmembrane sensor
MSNGNSHIDIDLLARYFSGECTPGEREHVHEWKEASAENRSEFESLQQVWGAMDKTSPDRNIDVEAEWENHQLNYMQTETRQKKIRSLSFPFRIAASFIILLGIGYFAWSYFSKETITSEIASTRQITLPDGSRVTLNAGSKLTYASSYGEETRTVSLRGEAFFEVSKNESKPFIINLENAVVKVLGTSFNVKAYKDRQNVEVTVADGTVSVYKKGDEKSEVVITKGQLATFNAGEEKIERKENTDRNFIAWKTRAIVFENDSLVNVVKTLQSVYHQEFLIENSQLNNCTVTTSFENRDLLSVLKVLKITLDISFEEKDGKIVIKGKGC